MDKKYQHENRNYQQVQLNQMNEQNEFNRLNKINLDKIENNNLKQNHLKETVKVNYGNKLSKERELFKEKELSKFKCHKELNRENEFKEPKFKNYHFNEKFNKIKNHYIDDLEQQSVLRKQQFLPEYRSLEQSECCCCLGI